MTQLAAIVRMRWAVRCRVGVALAIALGGCSSTTVPDPVISRVDPDAAPNTTDVPIRIEGSGFHLPFTSDLDRGTLAVGAMTVALDDMRLANAAWRDDGLIEGIVPAGTPIGTYDVTLTIDRRSVVLHDGYTVTSGPPLHLAPGDGMPGSDPWSLTGNVTIDTTTLAITGAVLPAGDVFDVKLHDGTGTELAVLHVGALDVAAGANVSIVGTRPLVIVAGGDVGIAGLLDASAHGVVPGPGGAAPGAGVGAGNKGAHETSRSSDSGGGGGGYAQAGGDGGALQTTCPTAGGVGGVVYGDAAISQLVGGSGGAQSSGLGCPPDLGGAGGGALQISSATVIRVEATGQIDAGGGGGTGGTDCGTGDANSAAGGGSGGSIVLQAPSIANAGVIAANGGGGGGGADGGVGSGTRGQDGLIGSSGAIGGNGPAGLGGTGGTGAMAPTAGQIADCGLNAPGGGGGVGRIAASVGFVDGGTVSPAPDTSLPP